MIVSIIGQPHSGKTTLAERIFKHEMGGIKYHVDGDKLRKLFNNNDYSREGRIKNLNRASDIAIYLNSLDNVVLSLVYPYQEARTYLDNLCSDICWIYLTYRGIRGREANHVKDFEIPISNMLHIDTTHETIDDCLSKINLYVYAKIFSKNTSTNIV